MALSTARWSALIILTIAGVYMLLIHTDPLPANHEAVGLGTNHVAHALIGAALLVGAGYVWISARRAAVNKPPV